MLKEMWRFSKKRYVFELLKIMFESVKPFPNIIFPALIINEIVLGAETVYIWIYVALFILSNVIITVVLNVLGSRQFFYETDFFFYIESLAVKKFMSLDLANIETTETHDKYQMAQSADVGFIFDEVRQAFVSIFQIIGCIVIILTFNVYLVFIILLVSVINGVVQKKNMKYANSKELERASLIKRYEYYKHIASNYGFSKEIRLNRLVDIIVNRIKKNRDAFFNIFKDLENKSFFSGFVINIINLLLQGAVYWLMVYSFINGRILIGSFSAYVASIETFRSALGNFASSINECYTKGLRVSHLRNFMAIENTMDAGGDKPDFKEFTIKFKDVSFKYPNSDTYVLKDINVEIPFNQKVLIVGENGAGKSTFIKLMLRLYDPSEGQILINGRNIKEFSLKDYRNLFGIMFQDFKIFSFTLRENIVFGDSSFNDEDIYESIETAGYKNVMEKLENGLDSYIFKDYDDSGMELSGGELQKIALSRCIVRNSSCIIFDEPASALDALAERDLYEYFMKRIENKTGIFISHRMSSAAFCDKIIVIDSGRIAEYGTRHELMELDGVFKKLYDMQSQYYIENEGK